MQVMLTLDRKEQKRSVVLDYVGKGTLRVEEEARPVESPLRQALETTCCAQGGKVRRSGVWRLSQKALQRPRWTLERRQGRSPPLSRPSTAPLCRECSAAQVSARAGDTPRAEQASPGVSIEWNKSRASLCCEVVWLRNVPCWPSSCGISSCPY
jgi:hypothetical protein